MVESCCRHEEGLMHFVVHVQLFLFFEIFLSCSCTWMLCESCGTFHAWVQFSWWWSRRKHTSWKYGTLSVLSRPVPSCFRGKYNQPFSPPGAQWNGYSVQMRTHKTQRAKLESLKSKRNLNILGGEKIRNISLKDTNNFCTSKQHAFSPFVNSPNLLVSLIILVSNSRTERLISVYGSGFWCTRFSFRESRCHSLARPVENLKDA